MSKRFYKMTESGDILAYEGKFVRMREPTEEKKNLVRKYINSISETVPSEIDFYNNYTGVEKRYPMIEIIDISGERWREDLELALNNFYATYLVKPCIYANYSFMHRGDSDCFEIEESINGVTLVEFDGHQVEFNGLIGDNIVILVR